MGRVRASRPRANKEREPLGEANLVRAMLGALTGFAKVERHPDWDVFMGRNIAGRMFSGKEFLGFPGRVTSGKMPECN